MSDQDSYNKSDHAEGTEAKLRQIKELESKLKLLRRGMFVGVLAIIALGALIIYNNVKQEAKPAIDMVKEMDSTFKAIKPKLDTTLNIYNRNAGRVENLVEQVTEIQTDIQTTVETADKWKALGDNFQTETQGQMLENLNGLTSVYSKMQPDIEKAFKTLDALVGNDEEFAAKVRADFETEYEKSVKPAAEDLSKKILVDIQHEAGAKFSEVSSHADEIMAGATRELYTLTNSIPEKVTFAINETLVKMINSRDEKLRKMFPKLTKEKQAALVSRLSGLSKEQGEKIFLNLFADHVSELGKVSDSLQKIQKSEPSSAGSGGGKLGDIQTSLALLSAVLEIAKEDFSTEVDITTPIASPDNNKDKPENKNPPKKKEPKKTPTPEKKTASKTGTQAKPEEKK